MPYQKNMSVKLIRHMNRAQLKTLRKRIPSMSNLTKAKKEKLLILCDARESVLDFDEGKI